MANTSSSAEGTSAIETIPANTAPGTKKISILSGIAYSVILNAVLPYVIYTLLKDYTTASDFVALVVSGIPPIIDSIVGVIRKGRIDLIAGISLAGIAVSIVLILLGGDTRLYLIRESFFTFAFGAAYLISLLFPRPLGFYFARAFMTGNVPEKITWFNSLWQHQGFRHMMKLTTVVWGIGFLLEAIIRTILAFTLSIPQFLIISPFVLYGFIGGIILWTMIYSRKHGRRAQTTQTIENSNA